MRPLSKADQLKLRAMEAGFQAFEADAFKHCLARFEHAVRAEEQQRVAQMVKQTLDAMLLSSYPQGMKEKNERTI